MSMTQAPPLVSIIIPAFNAAPVLVEALESARVQTFQNFEAIIVDDGSTDDTTEIARRFCAGDSRFRLLRQANAGLPAARNTALGQANGEWIAFLDADDAWLAQKLERQLALAGEDLHANFLFANFYFWDGARDLAIRYRANRPLPDGDTSTKLIFSNMYGISTVIVRRETISAVGEFDKQLFCGCEDWDLWLRIAERGLWARGLREPLVRYRRWPGNMTSKKMTMTEAAVRVLEKNLAATQRPESRPVYRRSLAFARAKLELIRARYRIETEPGTVSPAILRAWRLYPQRVEWLLWYLLTAWPDFLGGRATAAVIHRKMIRKW